MKNLLIVAAAFCCAFAFVSCEKEEAGDNTKQQNNDPQGLTISVQKDWSASVAGEPIEVEDSWYQYLIVTAPGIKYYWIDAWTDNEIKEYYGTLDSLILGWESDVLEAVKEGYKLSDYLWTENDPEVLIDYYDEGPYDIYIVEFDEKGYATGRIGITKNVTFPSIPQAAPLRAPTKNSTIGDRPQLYHFSSSARNLDV